MAPTRCSVRWGDDVEKTIRVKRKGGVVHKIPFDLLVYGMALPPDAAVTAPIDSGPQLLSALVDLKEAGTISSLTVRSWDRGSTTKVGSVDVATIRAWETSRLAGKHPVIQKISPFLPCGSPGALCDLIGTIFDPRWYFDSEHPNRLARLESFLQLSPRWDVTDDKPITGPRALMLACFASVVNRRTTACPRDYLGRLGFSLIGAGYDSTKVIRKTCRCFLRALVAAWQDARNEADNGERQGDKMFVPELLFDREALDAVMENT